MNIEPIAYISTDFPQKFGIPRQAGIAAEAQGVIRFVGRYATADAVRGIEGFSHIWLIWEFQGVNRERWQPTVCPPRLGGRKRVGVFATRSPNRPNPLGLSCVRLERVELTAEGPLLYVRGADLRDHTPIYDIKPYVRFADSVPEARSGFVDGNPSRRVKVEFPAELRERIAPDKLAALVESLEQDPRPPLHDDPEKEYKLAFARWDVTFTVAQGVLRVCDVTELPT